jgi:hypothetical protein
MKKLILVLSILYSALFANAQSYSPFVVEGAHWQMSEGFCMDVGGCDGSLSIYPYQSTVYRFKLEGDTTVDSVLYKKLYQSFFSQIQYDPWYTATNAANWFLTAIVREDIAKKEVYIRQISSLPLYWCPGTSYANDSLLYSFADSGMDSIGVVYKPLFPTSECLQDSFWVDTIYNTTNYGYTRKTWFINSEHLQMYNNFRLMEGIGYSFGLFGTPGPNFESSYYSSLELYCIGSDSVCWKGFLYNDIDNVNANIPFSLSPNPASSYLTINISEEHTGSTFALTDLAGRVVLKSEIENSKSEISMATLPSGIYLAVLTTPSGQRAVRKVVRE